MKKIIIFWRLIVLFFILSTMISVSLKGAITASERAALITLYNATNGDGWQNNSGWKGNNDEADGFSEIGSEDTWYGINVRDDRVVEIELADNNLNGDIPVALVDLSNLEYLNLMNNHLSGSIPAALGNLSNLEDLWLGSNQISGSIPSELGNLSNLKYLDLGGNQLSGSIPPELGNLSNLVLLEVDDSQLTGSIPLELLNLTNLQYLQLGNNQLTGTVPMGLENLSNLRGLELSDNQLTGTIPPGLGNLSNLQYLELGPNQLTGTIPAELGNLGDLLHLFLNGNHLSGNIPAELGNLSNLEILWLNANQLIGTIPSSFSNLTNLSSSQTYIGYNGLHTNDDRLREFLNDKDPDWEETQTIVPSNLSAFAVSTSSIRISWTPITYVYHPGGYNVYYSTTTGGPWTYVGITTDKLAYYYDVTGLSAGIRYYFVVKTQTNPHVNNSNTVISDFSEEVSSAIGDIGPFGKFETPTEGSTVSSSIPVTGWALDDFGVKDVKIYVARENELFYIGVADFVEGARPDVEEAFPGYPNNHKAGWGYMMLTNALPLGDGLYKIYAFTTDIEGNQVTLGPKTIICDNANAVKPFGAIDTPPQGGIASGSDYRNNGWVLTPPPNLIPIDGSTINVYVDGVNLGNPTYNIYREDVANLFPGYANSSGAHAYFSIDTTAYSDDVHIIYWTATDNAGNPDGIGSRYFSIKNSQVASQSRFGASPIKPGWLPNPSVLPVDDSEPVTIRKGHNQNGEPGVVYPDTEGLITIEIKELERLEMRFVTETAGGLAPLYSAPRMGCIGYQMVGNRLVRLPIGSTLDSEMGVFYWQPGAGFIGEYRFVFVVKGPWGKMSRKNITVTIRPKSE